MDDWDDLRTFLAVARMQRVAPAARQLGVDVSTVGRRLVRLEAARGTTLFETVAGARRLSAAGEALLTHVEAMEAAAIASAGAPAAGPAGHVRLSLAEGLATHVVAPALDGFVRRYPGVRLDLVTASGFLNPSRREADVAVMLARPRGRQLRASRLSDYRLRLYAAPAYLDRAGVPAAPAELMRHVLVGYVPEFIHAVELDYLAEIHDGLVASIGSTSIVAQHAAIASGAGIGILPDFIGGQDPRLTPVLSDEVALRRQYWLVTHEGFSAAPRIAAVAGWLRQVTAQLT